MLAGDESQGGDIDMDRRVTTQDISWFLDLHRNGQLNLDPSYQRRSVWSPRDRRFFLDTIFRGYPSPSIFLHKVLDDSELHVHDVVDGKQRLQTILMFVNNEIALAKDFGDVSLDGKKWKELGEQQRRSFWDYVIPVEFILFVEGTVVNEVFDRLNRNSRKLERQELRHAKYEGWFITVCEQESEDPLWKELGVVTTARVKRMKDVQFLSELLIVLLTKKVVGFDQDMIDQVYADYEDPSETHPDFSGEEFRERIGQVKAYLRKMEDADQAVFQHVRTSIHLYSLWALIAINIERVPDPRVAAERYHQFMEKVDRLNKEADLYAFLQKHETDEYSAPLQYLENARGASTEAVQREQRDRLLCTAILREGDA